MKLTHLKKRAVINIYNGHFMGYISDVIITLPNGKIETLIVKKNLLNRVMKFFFANNKIYIPWDNIISIGKDVILVNIIDN